MNLRKALLATLAAASLSVGTVAMTQPAAAQHWHGGGWAAGPGLWLGAGPRWLRSRTRSRAPTGRMSHTYDSPAYSGPGYYGYGCYRKRGWAGRVSACYQ